MSDMETGITPALTKEEWDYAADSKRDFMDDRLLADRYHAVAAVALYGQPFGFTREDVRLLKVEADHEMHAANFDEMRSLESLAARIEALLPPE